MGKIAADMVKCCGKPDIFFIDVFLYILPTSQLIKKLQSLECFLHFSFSAKIFLLFLEEDEN